MVNTLKTRQNLPKKGAQTSINNALIYWESPNTLKPDIKPPKKQPKYAEIMLQGPKKAQKP